MRLPLVFLCCLLLQTAFSADLSFSTTSTYAVTNSDQALSDAMTLDLTAVPSNTVAVQIAISGVDGAFAVPPVVVFQPSDSYSSPRSIQIDTTRVDPTAAGQNFTITATVLNETTTAEEYLGLSAEFTIPLHGDIVFNPSSDSPLFIAPGSTLDLFVSLGAPPSNGDTTTLTFDSDGSVFTVDPTTLSFTADNYDTPQNVTLTAVNVGNYSLSVSAVGGGFDLYSVDPVLLTTIVSPVTPDLSSFSDISISGPAIQLPIVPFQTVAENGSLTVTVTTQSDCCRVVTPNQIVFLPEDGVDAKSVFIAPQFGLPSGVINIAWTSTGDSNFPAGNFDLDISVGQAASTSMAFDDGVTSIRLGYVRYGHVSIAGPPCPNSNVYVSAYVADGSATVTPQFLTFTPGDYNTPKDFTIRGLAEGDVTVVTVLDSSDSNFAGLTAETTIAVSSAAMLRLSMASLFVVFLALILAI